jgi:hypothetical protein
MHDLRQNKALGWAHSSDFSPIARYDVRALGVAETFAQTFRANTGPIDHEWGISSASTDFVRSSSGIIRFCC